MLERYCPTWHLTGEERQVHYGESFVDPPDFATDAFRAFVWLHAADSAQLAERVDCPWCQADLYYLLRLAITVASSDGGPK